MKSEEKSRDSSVENEKSHPPGTWRHQRPVQRLAFFFHELFRGITSQKERLSREDRVALLQIISHVSQFLLELFSTKMFAIFCRQIVANTIAFVILSRNRKKTCSLAAYLSLSVSQASQRHAILPRLKFAPANKLMLPASRGIRELGRLSGDVASSEMLLLEENDAKG